MSSSNSLSATTQLSNSPQSKTSLLLLLVGISAVGPIVLNGVVPANSQIVRDLSTTYGMAQLVLTVYLFAYMVSQIVLGNLADRYGRRPVMIWSLFVFALGGFICATAPSMEILLIGRFVQGFGSSVCAFLPRTIVRDVYTRDRSASVIGYMTTAMMVAPLFGPALGGWLTDASSWRVLYALLCALGLVFCFLSWLYLSETLPESEVRPIGSRFRDSFRLLLKKRIFVSLLLLQVGSVGVYYAFLGGAPYILMELRGMSASQYGLWFMQIATGYLLGNLCAGWFSNRLGVYRMIHLSMVPAFLGFALFWILSQWQHPLALFVPMQITAFGNGMGLPSLASASMSVRPELAGSASGIIGTAQTAMGVLLTLLLGLLLHQNALPFYLLVTLSATIMSLGYYLLLKQDLS